MVIHMEYFKKIQCYKPDIGIIDAPVRIEEIALLQDSVCKNMLGRIKFINQSTSNIIAIFVNMKVQNVAGEVIPLDSERFIYQDMKLLPGDLYGNKVAIDLPVDTRKFDAALKKVVFEDGSVWDSDGAETCIPIPQELIEIPEECFERFLSDISAEADDLDYAKYCFEETKTFWECSCGKINSFGNDKCSFCSLDKQIQKRYLSKKELDARILKIKTQINKEKEEQERIEQEKREEQQRIKELEFQKKKEYWEQEAREKQELREREEKKAKKRKKRNIIILIVVVLSLVFGMGGYTYSYWNKMYEEGVAYLEQGEYSKAAKKFSGCTIYSDGKSKYNEALKEQTKIERQELLDKIFNPDSDMSEDLANILCYMGKPYDFVKNNSEIDLENFTQDGYYYVGKSDSYWYSELKLEFYSNYLSSVEFSWCGYPEVDYPGRISKILNKGYDDSSSTRYSWDIENTVFSRVVLEEDGFSLDGYDWTLEFYE